MKDMIVVFLIKFLLNDSSKKFLYIKIKSGNNIHTIRVKTISDIIVNKTIRIAKKINCENSLFLSDMYANG